MRRAPLFLCIVVLFPALLFLLWPTARHTFDATEDAERSGKQTHETTALRRASSQPDLVEASAILRIEMSRNVEAADLTSALGALLERPQLDEISARLALETAWSMDADRTAQHLAKILKVSLSKDSESGIVRASDSSPVMAASLANTAASVLRDHFERTAKETQRLEKDIRNQRDLMEDKRKLLASIIRSGMMIYQAGKENPPEEPAEPASKPEADTTPHEAVYVDAKGDLERTIQELSRMEDQRREMKEITIHHILWAQAKAEQ